VGALGDETERSWTLSICGRVIEIVNRRRRRTREYTREKRLRCARERRRTSFANSACVIVKRPAHPNNNAHSRINIANKSAHQLITRARSASVFQKRLGNCIASQTVNIAVLRFRRPLPAPHCVEYYFNTLSRRRKRVPDLGRSLRNESAPNEFPSFQILEATTQYAIRDALEALADRSITQISIDERGQNTSRPSALEKRDGFFYVAVDFCSLHMFTCERIVNILDIVMRMQAAPACTTAVTP